MLEKSTDEINKNHVWCYLFQQYSGQYEPSWVKFKYGAWYLDPKTWQKRDADEPLMDPKELKDKEMSEAKKMSKGLVSTIILP